MNAQERAADLLVHYFRIAFQEAGAGWDSDNASEVSEIVDLIGDMVRDEVHAQLAEAAEQPGGEPR